MDKKEFSEENLEFLLDASKNFKVFHEFRKKELLENGFKTTLDELLSINCDYPLFYVKPDFDISFLDSALNEITLSLPAIKRIFTKPIIHLKETNDVLPIESVRTTSMSTINYMGNHSETIGNIIKGELVPKKLLTKVCDDDYGIYENVIFCNAVDEVLRFSRRNLNLVKKIVYSLTTIRKGSTIFNHKNYLSAIGRFASQFNNDAQIYYNLIDDYTKNFNLIINTIQPRLKSRIYNKNRHRNKNMSLHTTNIFKMQKDYHRVFKLYKYLLNNNVNSIQTEEFDIKDYKDLYDDYYSFCLLLTVYSIGFMSFTCDKGQILDFKKIINRFYYKNNPKIYINVVDLRNSILLDFNKDSNYRVLLVPRILNDISIDKEVEKYKPNKIIYTTIDDVDYFSNEDVYIGIDNIDSFLRIQQIVLNGMIQVDKEKNICPFCGGRLFVSSTSYICNACKLEINEKICNVKNKKYYNTTLPQEDLYKMSSFIYENSKALSVDRRIESSFFYKNINRLNEHNEFICPCCKNVHNE